MRAVLWMKSSCTTCRNAKARLAELAGLLPTDPTPMLGNKSPKFKELGLKDRRLSKAEAVELMVQDNNLLKRPILVHPKGTVIGFDAEAYARLLA